MTYETIEKVEKLINILSAKELDEEESVFLSEMIGYKNKRKEYFPITAIHRHDLEHMGFDTSEVDDSTMETLASKMKSDYLNQLYWQSAEIIAGEILEYQKDKLWE